LLLCRRLSPVEVNIINILRSYFNEVANVTVHLLSTGIVLTAALGRLPSPLAKLASWWMWCLATLLPVINLLHSGFQLAIVANIEALFEVHPLPLGRAAFLVALLLTLLPNIVSYGVTGSTGHLTETVFEPLPLQTAASPPPSFDFLAWHLTGWLIASIILFVSCFLGIPMYLTMQSGGFAINHFNYFPQLTWKRCIFFMFAIGYLWIIITLADNPDHDGHIPFYNFVFLCTLNWLFTFQLMDEEVFKSVRMHWLDSAIVHPEDDALSNEMHIHGIA
jgi:hypothetical protein